MTGESSSSLPSWPPKLNDDQLFSLTTLAIDYALSHSIAYRPVVLPSEEKPAQDTTIHAPFSLLPSPFPKSLFEKSQKLQPLYNDLYARITVNHNFLEKVIGKNVIFVDEFQSKLWKIYKQVQKEGILQSLHLGLFRSDYLLHQDSPESELDIKQVEINTISSSFGPLCSRVSELHRYLARSTNFFNISSQNLKLENIPINRALETLASGLAAGHKTYVERSKQQQINNDDDAIILFVVQDGERNAFDQRLIEYQLLEQHGIRVRRASLEQLSKLAKIQGDQRKLFLSNKSSEKDEEVSVVYFRAGYGPNDYPSQIEWDVRLLLERSFAIKCPTIALQLAGAKKVQQVLSDPDIVESLVEQGDSSNNRKWTKEEIKQIKQSFMPMYGMEKDGEGIEIASNPIKSKDYVLKPQREGGGNNIYRQEIVKALKDLDEEDQKDPSASIKRREGYILMKLIETPKNVGNYFVRFGSSSQKTTTTTSLSNTLPKAILAPHTISELGAFGTILFESATSGTTENNSVKILFEQSGGHLLRTKASESDEGGVAAGFSVIDSPVLI